MSHSRLFRAAADEAIAYRGAVNARGPVPTVSPKEAIERFAGPTPEAGSDPEIVLDELARAAAPGLMGMTSRRFFGWVIGSSNPVGVAADWMASAWGQNAGNHYATPSAAAAEKAAGDWLLDVLRLPPESSVGFVTGATMANFVGLAAGRGEVLRRAGVDLEEVGLQGAPRLRVIVGGGAHSTLFASLRYLGVGRRQIETVPTDDQGAMLADAFAETLAAGNAPTVVAAQAGHLNTGAFDPIDDIADLCRAAGAWLHVDGAFGLWARACADRAFLAKGVDKADSWATDGHKWLQAPYDTGFAIVRDRAAHRRATAIMASYLPVDEENHDPSHFAPELSRRARGFATWSLLKHFGRAGIEEMVSRHCALARRVAANVADEPGVEVLNRVVLNQVLIGFGEGEPEDLQNEAAQEVIAEVQRRNEVFVEGSLWRGRRVMRVSVISEGLQPVDIDRLADEILEAWRCVRARRASSAA